jgi:hypothetical protein
MSPDYLGKFVYLIKQHYPHPDRTGKSLNFLDRGVALAQSNPPRPLGLERTAQREKQKQGHSRGGGPRPSSLADKDGRGREQTEGRGRLEVGPWAPIQLLYV